MEGPIDDAWIFFTLNTPFSKFTCAILLRNFFSNSNFKKGTFDTCCKGRVVFNVGCPFLVKCKVKEFVFRVFLKIVIKGDGYGICCDVCGSLTNGFTCFIGNRELCACWKGHLFWKRQNKLVTVIDSKAVFKLRVENKGVCGINTMTFCKVNVNIRVLNRNRCSCFCVNRLWGFCWISWCCSRCCDTWVCSFRRCSFRGYSF